MTTLDIDGQWTDKQREATRKADKKRYFLFGGARGPGKSRWLRWYSLRYLYLAWQECGLSGVRVMLACEDYPSLWDRQISKILTEFPSWFGTWQAQHKEYQLRPEFGAGVICLRNLDDASKYQSAEFALIAVDELTKDTESTFNNLRGSLRWTGIDRPQFIAATNPNGIGAPWVRGLWIERAFPPHLATLADEFAFVPGLPADNPYLSQSYIDELKAQPTAIRKAWLEGDWWAGVEGLVYPEFTADNICDDEPDPTQPIELAFDDGYIDPRAILFIQRTGNGALVFDELYQTKTLAEQSVQDTITRCKDNAWPLPELAVGSPEAKELQERLRMANIAVRFQAHEVVQGITLLRGLFCDSQGVRAVKVHRRCRNLIRELTEGYVYSEGQHGLHEKPEKGNDHAADALRYWCYRRMR